MSQYPEAPPKTKTYLYEVGESDDPYEQAQRVIHAAEELGINLHAGDTTRHKLQELAELLIAECLIAPWGGEPRQGCWANFRSAPDFVVDHIFLSTGFACMLCRAAGDDRGWLICECGTCGPECTGRAIRRDILDELTEDGQY